VLQVDGYGAYKALVKRSKPGRIRLAFCLAHARRQFVAVHKTTQSPEALDLVQRIAAVYAIEERIRGGTAEHRKAVREAESKPLMEALNQRLFDLLKEISVKSKMAKAIRYTLGHWNGLTLFLADGRVEVDSNTIERTMRAIALGRRNSLFAGSERGARNWACLASLLNTCLCRARHRHVYAEHQTMPSCPTFVSDCYGLVCTSLGIVWPRIACRLSVDERHLLDGRLRECLPCNDNRLVS